MSKITIKDISKALSVSISTVSKALSDSHEISEATKRRIREYADQHDFSINKVAQSLKLGKTNTIGVIACAINNDFVSQILDGIQQASIEHNYDIIIMQSMEDPSVEKSCIEVLRHRGVDGILISPVSDTSNIDLLENIKGANTPIVLFDRIGSRLKTHKFGVNNFEGAYRATEHLIQQGRKNILHITGSQLGVATERFNGFKAALIKHDLPFEAQNYVACNLKNSTTLDNEIRRALERTYATDGKIDAVFGATDVITIRTLGVLAEMGIKVPDEIAVIGFTNTKVAFALNPALSTVSQPAKEIGYLSMNKLVKMIKSKYVEEEFETIELETSMQIRKSSI